MIFLIQGFANLEVSDRTETPMMSLLIT